MPSSLFFTCGFQKKEEWIVLSNRRHVFVDEMLFMMEYIRNNIGGARLEYIPEPEVGISELSVQFDGEKYLFTLSEYSENGEYLIRCKSGFSGEWRLVEFLLDGELYPPNAITTDFEFIKKVFVELLKTGGVSYDLMERVY